MQRKNLTAALGFAQLEPRAPELRLLHRWLDTWTGLGLVVVGVEPPRAPELRLLHRWLDTWRGVGVLAAGLTGDVEAFIREHRDHGQLVGDATEPAANGYMLEVACPCGVTFARWVAPLLAAEDLAALARLN